MKTPIYDFVSDYIAKNGARLHMPGHKGRIFLGAESRDITEICGADSLFEADGIIAESEKTHQICLTQKGLFIRVRAQRSRLRLCCISPR